MLTPTSEHQLHSSCTVHRYYGQLNGSSLWHESCYYIVEVPSFTMLKNPVPYQYNLDQQWHGDTKLQHTEQAMSIIICMWLKKTHVYIVTSHPILYSQQHRPNDVTSITNLLL